LVCLRHSEDGWAGGFRCYHRGMLPSTAPEREARMIRACEIANADPDVLRIEQEWDGLRDEADKIVESSGSE